MAETEEWIARERSYVIGSRAWTVSEVVDRLTLSPTLIFMSDGVGRRVRNFPSEWHELSAEELELLSWST